MKHVLILLFLTQDVPAQSFYTDRYLKYKFIIVGGNPFYVVETVGNYCYGYPTNWLGRLLIR